MGWWIYLIYLVGNVQVTFIVIPFLLIIPILVHTVIFVTERDFKGEEALKKWDNKYKKYWMRIYGPIIGICLLGALLIPDTKTIAAIYVIPKIAKNDSVKNITPLLAKSAEKYLIDYLSTGDSKND